MPQPTLSPRAKRRPRYVFWNQSSGHSPWPGTPEIDSLMYSRTIGLAIQLLCVGWAASASQNVRALWISSMSG